MFSLGEGPPINLAENAHPMGGIYTAIEANGGLPIA